MMGSVMKMRTLTVATLVAGLAALAMPSAQSGQSGSRGAAVPAEALAQIKAANDGWLPALERQDAAAVAEPYADDAIFVTPTGEVARGRPGVEQLMKGRFAASRVVGGSLTQDGVSMAG